MSKCEDYPCCGHEMNDCPDSEGRMKCVECGLRLKKDARSSICDTCLNQFRQFDEHDRPMREDEFEEEEV